MDKKYDWELRVGGVVMLITCVLWVPPNPINPWLTTHGGRATWPPQNHTAMGCTGVILNTARMAYKATMMHRCQFVEDMLVIANKPFVDCSFVYL